MRPSLMRARDRRRVTRLVVALVMSGLVGCNAPGLSTLQPVGTPSVPGATAAACKGAQTEGVLEVLGAPSTLALRRDDGLVLGLIWPQGYSVTDNSVLDEQRTVIAKVGDYVLVDGGEARAGWWEVCAGSLVLLPAPSQ
jgi:hypothetical protein